MGNQPVFSAVSNQIVTRFRAARLEYLHLLFLTLATTAAAADVPGDIPVTARMTSIDEWGFSTLTFCPHETIRYLIEVENTNQWPVTIEFCGGEKDRVGLRVLDESGNQVWSSDAISKSHNPPSQFENDIGEIQVGAGILCTTHELEPGQSAFHIGSWNQVRSDGSSVSNGTYVLDLEYGWLVSSDRRIPIHFVSKKVHVSDAECE